MRLNNAIYSLSDSGKKVTLNGIKRRIYMSPMQVINSITDNKNMTNLISYRDLVNDNDALLALKYTYKGISGLGEGSAKIQEGYRYVDTSHIGIVDLDSSTVSDPGMSGTLCPLGTMAEKYPMSFTDFEEPNFWREKYLPFQTSFYEKNFPGVKEALVWEREEPSKEYLDLRNKVINEHLAIDTVQVALVDAVTGKDDNWSMEYIALQQLREQEENIPTLFSVRSDDDED